MTLLQPIEAVMSTHTATSNVVTKPYHLAEIAQQGLSCPSESFTHFQHRTGLADFFWEASYDEQLYGNQPLNELFQHVEGVVIFLHGWDGSHRIWEDLPQRLVEQNPRLVCLNADINGFGQSPFIDDHPKPEQATLPAAMAAVEQWLDIIGAGQRDSRPFHLFVGHSMGAGMMFYKDDSNQTARYGCYVMAPGIFYRNILRYWAYKVVALATLIPGITPLKNLTARLVIRFAMNNASQVAKYEHEHTFYRSSFKTLAHSLAGIAASPEPTRTDWSQYRVVLGHTDILARLPTTIVMLQRLGFTPDQIKVLVGDHYFFSYDETSPESHRYNREIVLNDLLNFCQRLTNI